MFILLCAGHYPNAPGACNGDFCEHAEAVLWVNRVKKMLEEDGMDTIIVPTGNLRKKVNFVNSKNAELAIEFHFNSNVAAHGSESLYYPHSTSGLQFADTMQSHLSVVFPPNRGSKKGYLHTDMKSKKLLYFLAKTKCTALIVEPEFVYNKETIQEKREEGCRAIANAIKLYKSKLTNN